MDFQGDSFNGPNASCKVIVDSSQADKLQKDLEQGLMNWITAALFDACGGVVDVAKQNATSSMRTISGRLVGSLKVLTVRPGNAVTEVDIGSDLPGYPFFQEYGWTTRTGLRVKAKLYFTKAVWGTQAEVLEKVTAEAQGHILALGIG